MHELRKILITIEILTKIFILWVSHYKSSISEASINVRHFWTFSVCGEEDGFQENYNMIIGLD